MAQSVVLETGPQPQYCHLCIHPCKSPEDCLPQKLPSRENLCQLWNGGVGPGPSTSAASLSWPRKDEQLRLWPLPHPQFSPSAAACSPLSFLHITGMCAACSGSVRLLLFSSAFDLRWHRGPTSQLLSCYLLTLRGKFSNCRSRMEIFCCPVQFFGWGPGRLRPSYSPLLLIVPPPSPHLHKGQGWSVPWSVYLPARELWPAPGCPLEGDKGATGWPHPRLWAAALHAGTQLSPSAPPSLSSGLLRVNSELPFQSSQLPELRAESGGDRVQLDNP